MSTKRSPASPSDITTLRSLLSSTTAQVFTPSDPNQEGYRASIARWSRAAEKPAAICIEPTTAEEVSIVVKYANEKHLDVAVKGGGHSTAGASSTDGGVLINLRRMRSVRTDVAAQRVYAQGGCLWMDVDNEAWKHGLATVGGTVADTGVGGLTLGGGYGVLSGQYGLVIDVVREMTTVVASGEIVVSSREQNEDLFWALLGGGQNFGVTTEFVFQAYPQKQAFMGTFLYPATEEILPKLVTAVNNLYHAPSPTSRPNSNGKTNNFLGLIRPPPLEGKLAFFLICFFDGPEDQGRKAYAEFFDPALKPIDCTVKMDIYPNINKQFPSVEGIRSSMKGAAYKLPIQVDFVREMMQGFNDLVAKCPDAEASVVAWELYDLTVINSMENGCFANRGFHLNGLVMPLWTKEENDGVCRQWARDMSEKFKRELIKGGAEAANGIEGGASLRGRKGAVMLYGNYDQYDEKARDVFGDNFDRLSEIKGRYDPQNMFSKLFPITPKV